MRSNLNQALTPEQLLSKPLIPDNQFETRLNRHARFLGPKEKGEGAYLLIWSQSLENSDSAASQSVFPKNFSPETLEKRWFDVDYRLNQALSSLNWRSYHGDCVPVAQLYFGCGNLAGLLGGPYLLERDTIWFDADPPLKDLDNLPQLSLDRQSVLYKAIKETAKRLSALASGRFSVAMTDIGSNIDILLSLTPRKAALIDIRKKPQRIRGALELLSKFFVEFFQEHSRWILEAKANISTYDEIVYGGPWYKLMSESSCMISRSSFEELVLPILEREAGIMDRCIFNLDGLGQTHLLPAILESPAFCAVAWSTVPTLSEPQAAPRKNFLTPESVKVMRQIVKSKKKLLMSGVPPEDAEKILETIGSDGVCLRIEAKNPAEGEDLWRYLRRWTAF
jgi:hypothetical protein